MNTCCSVLLPLRLGNIMSVLRILLGMPALHPLSHMICESSSVTAPDVTAVAM